MVEVLVWAWPRLSPPSPSRPPTPSLWYSQIASICQCCRSLPGSPPGLQWSVCTLGRVCAWCVYVDRGVCECGWLCVCVGGGVVPGSALLYRSSGSHSPHVPPFPMTLDELPGSQLCLEAMLSESQELCPEDQAPAPWLSSCPELQARVQKS